MEVEGQMTHRHDEEEEGHTVLKRQKGGFITLPCIIVNESLEKMASYGLVQPMILYVITRYRMSVAGGTKLVNFWNAATNFMPVVGAAFADSYLGRFLAIGLGSILSFLGLVILWLTAVIPSWTPPPCSGPAGECRGATPPQYAILVMAFSLISAGAGGVRPCSQAFGADQLVSGNNPKYHQSLETFFNWYYACACFSILVGLTVVVGIQDRLGWRIGLGIPPALMLISILTFFAASSRYVKIKPGKSLFTSFAQVIVAACRSRNDCPLSPHQANYYHGSHSSMVTPTNNLSFLNRACLVRADNDICLDGSPRDPWRLTSVEEVEKLKALIRVLPIWSTGIVLSINTAPTFQVIQAQAMDRHLTSTFQVPAASYGMFTIMIIVLWLPVYDRVLIPLASKLRGKPVKIHIKVRMGIGLVFAVVSMAVAALVETVRRNRAVRGSPVMSSFWLVPQYTLNGFAEAFNAIGQTEFYYSQFPKSMSSIATSLFQLEMALGSLIANAIISTIDDITKKGGGDGWLASDINKGHYEYYYWLLAAMSFLSLLSYLFCSRAYGPCDGWQETRVTDEPASKE